MRILLLSQEYPPEVGIGGIGSYAATIAPALAARGNEVHVLCCRGGQRSSDEVIDGVVVHRRPSLAFRGFDRLQKIAPQSISRLRLALSCYLEARRLGTRFDVVESPEWMAEGLFFALGRKTPVVVHLHTPTKILAENESWPWTFDLRSADRLERLLTRRASVVTSPSALLVQTLLTSRWLTSPDVKVIPYPVRIDRVPDESVGSTAPIVIAVGRLERRKAPEVLVEAAARLRSDVPDLDVIFLGRSSGSHNGVPYGDWVARRAEELSAPCRFVGWVSQDDLPQWYGRARVVAVPSRFESYSMVLLEAMAAGRPAVFTTQVGAGEIARLSEGATEIHTEDAGSLADALRPYLLDADLAALAGASAAETVRTYCAPERIAELREAAYAEAIESGRRH